MKYVITERQHRFLIEQEIPNWFKRRFNAANMEKHITNGEIYYPTLCDDFGDEFEYADNVISYAVDEFMTIDEDIFEDGHLFNLLNRSISEIFLLLLL